MYRRHAQGDGGDTSTSGGGHDDGKDDSDQPWLLGCIIFTRVRAFCLVCNL
jgi:hypothetical protein